MPRFPSLRRPRATVPVSPEIHTALVAFSDSDGDHLIGVSSREVRLAEALRDLSRRCGRAVAWGEVAQTVSEPAPDAFLAVMLGEVGLVVDRLDVLRPDLSSFDAVIPVEPQATAVL